MAAQSGKQTNTSVRRGRKARTTQIHQNKKKRLKRIKHSDDWFEDQKAEIINASSEKNQ